MDYTQLLEFFPLGVQDLILATDVSDVIIQFSGQVLFDRTGELEIAANVRMQPSDVLQAVQNVARRLGDDLDKDRPILNSRLPDGSRVAAIYQNESVEVAIRKFNRWFSLEELDESGSFPWEISRRVVDGMRGTHGHRGNVLVAGGAGAGKSTLAKALIDKLPLSLRLISIESPIEYKLMHPFALQLEARDDTKTANGFTVAEALVASLRQRPDGIIIGEMRDSGAAVEFIQALNTGHSGSISTIHASSAADALVRLTDLAYRGMEASREYIERRVLNCIQFVVFVVRSGAIRRVKEVIQVKDCRDIEVIYEGE